VVNSELAGVLRRGA